MAGSSDKAVDLSRAMVMEPVPLADWLVIAPIAIAFIGGSICLMNRKNTALQPWLGIPFLGLMVLSNLLLLLHVLQNGVVTMVMGRWLPPFGIAFTADATGALLSLVASIVALVGGIYAVADIGRSQRRYGFYTFLLLLLAGVCGAFLTGDLFNLYVWLEVLLIASFGLIILGSEKVQIDGAVKYALLNLVATNIFLVATAYTYGVFGTLNMADLTLKAAADPQQGPILTIGALFVLGFAMKAAAFPVNFWLPASYHTPSIVVSAVFAGLLTKVGVYALLRIVMMILPGVQADLVGVLAWVAALTMIIGAFGALAQSDLRKMLGYLVISGIGSMIAGLAVGTGEGLSGAILYAVHSIVVMTALYLAIGIIARAGGDYDLRAIGGLYRYDHAFSALFFILVLAVAGLPPFSGFWPKVILVTASLENDFPWLAFALLLSGFLTTLAMGRVWLYAFWRGGPEGTPDGVLAITGARSRVLFASGEQAVMLVPVFVLVLIIVYLGLMPDPAISVSMSGAEVLLDPAAYVNSVFGPGAR